MENSSDKLRVLIAGGGVAALEALIGLRELAQERVALELLSPTSEFAYRPLAVAEPFGVGESRRYDLAEIARERGATLIEGALVRVDPDSRVAHLDDARELTWDVLVVAVGAHSEPPLPDAVTILGPDYTGRFRSVVRKLEERKIRNVAFVVPGGVSWALPLYELALMTAARVAERGLRKVQLHLVTHEDEPLEIFGREASGALRAKLAERGIRLHTDSYPAAFDGERLTLTPAGDGPIPAQQIVTLPVLTGPRIPGLPHDHNGFIPTDLHGLVEGQTDVYAAGDGTTFPVKQGGIATQEADAVAEAIAARAGAPLEPAPFRPVLRGMLLTEGAPTYMRAEIGGGRGEDWDVSEHALWWPPSKIAGRYLSPYLGLHHGELERVAGSVPVEVELERSGPQGVRRRAVIATGRDGTRAVSVDPD